MSAALSAAEFSRRLLVFRSDEELAKIRRYFKCGEGEYGNGDEFLGVKMGQVFDLARQFQFMPLKEVEKLLESPIHELRTGAVSILDFCARARKTDAPTRKALFDLYIRRHDRINNWDLVDRAAPHVVGGYLVDQPRDILYQLARSASQWERRTAITATWFFIRKGDVDDTFRIAEMLVGDHEDLIHKAVGGWIRAAGSKKPESLIAFLDIHAATVPRTMLRYAIEHLDANQKKHYMNLKKSIA